MLSEQNEFAGLWYALVREDPSRPPRWKDDDEAEHWLESVGAPDGYSTMQEPGLFTLLASRRVSVALAESLRASGDRVPDHVKTLPDEADTLREWGDRVMTDSAIMRDAPEGVLPAGVHPWCFDTSVFWEFWRMPREQALRVSRACRTQLGASEQLLLCYEDYMPIGGDIWSARMLIEALDAQDLDDDMLAVRESLRRWAAWATEMVSPGPDDIGA